MQHLGLNTNTITVSVSRRPSTRLNLNETKPGRYVLSGDGIRINSKLSSKKSLLHHFENFGELNGTVRFTVESKDKQIKQEKQQEKQLTKKLSLFEQINANPALIQQIHDQLNTKHYQEVVNLASRLSYGQQLKVRCSNRHVAGRIKAQLKAIADLQYFTTQTTSSALILYIAKGKLPELN